MSSIVATYKEVPVVYNGRGHDIEVNDVTRIPPKAPSRLLGPARRDGG